MTNGTKNYLVFGIIKKFFVFIFKFIYIFVKFLNLQPALLIGLIGLVLFLTGKLDGSGGALSTIFYILLIMSLFYSIIKTVQSILFPNRKNKSKNDRKVEIVEENEDDKEKTVEDQENPVTKQTVAPPVSVTPPKVTEETVTVKTSPVYYAVKQNPNYLMAEFQDRYELYLKTEKGLVKVRTDLKR